MPTVGPSGHPAVQLRSRARPRLAVFRRPALRHLPRLQRVRRCATARRPLRCRGALRLGPPHSGIRAARLRRAKLRATAAGGKRIPHRRGAEHDRTHQNAMAAPHAASRQRGRTFVPDSASQSVRRAGRPLPRGLLLGFLLHDARSGRERSHRSHEEHAGQLRASDQDGWPHPQRQSHLLPHAQPAPVLRGDGGTVRPRDRYRARPRVLGGARTRA